MWKEFWTKMFGFDNEKLEKRERFAMTATGVTARNVK